VHHRRAREDWLPKEHLAWFLLEVVEELDLAEFYAGYRADGRRQARQSMFGITLDHGESRRYRGFCVLCVS
jgi:hypothetical protein